MKTYTIVSVCDAPENYVPWYKDYPEMAVRLARSIRKNGGSLKDSDLVFWYGEDRKPRQYVIDNLLDLGARLVSGKCPYPPDRVSNQFSASQVKCNTDYILWLDADMYVNRPLDGLLDIDTDVAMAPDVFSHHTWSASEWDPYWDNFYKYFGVSRPDKIISHVDKKPINFYYNNAVTLFKNGIGFPELWQDTALKLINSGLPNCKHIWYMVATSLAVLRGNYTITPLPETLHYIYCIRKYELNGDPSIIHYQNSDSITQVSPEDWKI